MSRVFDYGGTRVRTVLIDGFVWFVAADVCAVLGHTNSRMALKRLGADEKGVTNVHTLGGPQAVSVISESGLYLLVMTSRKPAAQGFRKWVTGEVLPALRRTGRYEVPTAMDAAKAEAGPGSADVPGMPMVSSDMLPLRMPEFLALIGLSHELSRALSRTWEGVLLRDLAVSGRRDQACRHPVSGRWFFTRPELEAWWARDMLYVFWQAGILPPEPDGK